MIFSDLAKLNISLWGKGYKKAPSLLVVIPLTY